MTEVDLERIATLARTQLPGVPCIVEQTGGGVATIIVGDTYYPNGKSGDPWCEPVLAGPGWFTAEGFTEGRACLADFSVGYDLNDERFAHPMEEVFLTYLDEEQDDEGGPDTERIRTVEERIAGDLTLLYRDHPEARRRL
jgi:hypothetical protein